MIAGKVPQVVSRAGALAILILLVAAVWLVLVDPVLSAWQDKAEQAERSTELIAHLHQTAAEAPAVKRALAALAQEGSGQSSVIVAANPNLAGANLQAELKRLAGAAGAELRSIQQLPAAKQDAATRISVRAELQADTAQLDHLLYDIEIHNPTLLVRSLSVRGNEQQSAAQAQKPVLLNLRIEIVAFTGPPG